MGDKSIMYYMRLHIFFFFFVVICTTQTSCLKANQKNIDKCETALNLKQQKNMDIMWLQISLFRSALPSLSQLGYTLLCHPTSPSGLSLMKV